MTSLEQISPSPPAPNGVRCPNSDAMDRRSCRWALAPTPSTTNRNSAEFRFFSGGLQYALNPHIVFDVALTNGFGASPATSLLTIPSSNELLWMAKWSYAPGASESPPALVGAHPQPEPGGPHSRQGGLLPPAAREPHAASLTQLPLARTRSLAIYLANSLPLGKPPASLP